jgi:hypothetical protein
VALSVPTVLIATPGGAAPLLTCSHLNGKASFSPSVSSKTESVIRTVKWSRAEVTGCTGTNGITLGKVSLTSTRAVKENCLEFIQHAKGGTDSATSTITWNNNKTSVMKNLTVTWLAALQYKITGKISGGTQKPFVGKSIAMSIIYTNANLEPTCLTRALIFLRGKAKFTIG